MEGMQKCCTCKTEKMLEEFSKSKKTKSGRHRQCKQCNIEYKISYRERPDVIAAEAIRRQTYIAPDHVKAKIRANRSSPEFLEKRRERNKTKESTDSRRAYLARPDVKERRLALRRKRYAERWKNDTSFQLDARFRGLIRRSIKTGKNNQSWRSMVDFSIDEFKRHFEKQFTDGMSWGEFMAGNIHIDHIVPVADFNITSADCPEFKACWSLGNLRPMWSEANNKKRAQRLFLI